MKYAFISILFNLIEMNNQAAEARLKLNLVQGLDLSICPDIKNSLSLAVESGFILKQD